MLIILLVSVAAQAQVEVEVLSPEQTAAPGDFVTHAFSVANLGPAADIFTLELKLSPGLSSLVPLAPLPLDSGERKTVFVTVLVSPEARAGRNVVELTAVSQTDPTVRDSAVAIIEVIPRSAVEVIPPADLQVVPGLVAELPFVVINRGNTSDEYSLSAGSLRGFPVRVSPMRLALLPGERAEVSVEVAIPADAAQGRDKITLTASSVLFPEVAASATVTLTVLPPPPQAVGGTLFLELPVQLDVTLQQLLNSGGHETAVALGVETSGEIREDFQFALSFSVRDLLFNSFTFALDLLLGPLQFALRRTDEETRLKLASGFLQLEQTQREESSILALQLTPRLAEVALFSRLSLGERLGEAETAVESSLSFTVLDDLAVRLGFARFGPDFPGIPRDERSFTLSLGFAPLGDPLAAQVMVETLRQNLRGDPALPAVAQLFSTISGRLSLGEELPTLLFQLEVERRHGRGPFGAFPIAEEESLMLFHIRQSLLSILHISAFGERQRSVDHVAGTDFETIRSGFGLEFSWEGFSASLRLTQGLTEDLKVAEVVEEFRELATELGFKAALGSVQLGLSRSEENLTVSTQLTVEFAEGELSGAARLSLAEGLHELSLSFALSTRFDVVTGIVTKARVEGFVFLDEDRDGRRDPGEAGLPGLIMRLDGIRVLSNMMEEGFFRFPPVRPGAYHLDIENLPVTLAPLIPLPLELSLEVGQTLRVMIPLVRVGAIEGVVFHDEDRDGRRGLGEEGIPDVRVLLYAEDALLQERRTGPAGAFAFAELPPGTYTVKVDSATLPAGFELTTPAEVTVSLEPGERVLIEFGAAERPRPILFSPTAEFTFSPQRPKAGEAVTFDASASFDPDGVIVKYEWDIGDDGTIEGEGKIFEYVFKSAGEFPVRLTVTDNDGLTDSRLKTVSVSPP
jgi:hypothetical protein